MKQLTLVGCGFVGSIYIEEVLKRMRALKNEIDVIAIDGDMFEERNVANQNITMEAIGLHKAQAMADLVQKYNFSSYAITQRVGDKKGTIPVVAPGDPIPDLIVDAVDNIETRHYLWKIGKKLDIPVLHIGVSQEGTGFISWSLGNYSTFPLHPVTIAKMSPEQQEKLKAPSKTLPPCELVTFRGLGLNVGIAAAKATLIHWGDDLEDEYENPASEHRLTTWKATNYGHEMVEAY